FCMGRFDPQQLRDVWLAAAWNPHAQRVEAFTTWVPIPARGGWALDLGRRRPDSLPGAMDLLVVRTLRAARARGEAMPSLSLSAPAMVGSRESDLDPGGDAGAVPAGDPAATAGGAEAGAERRLAEPRRAPAADAASGAAPDRARAFLMQHLARFYDF